MAQPQFSTIGLSRPYLLYVGQRSGYKNFDQLLAAYAASPALHKNYDLIAFGGGVWTAAERKSIEELFLYGKVKQLQGGDGTLADLYANAAVFVYPSLYEGFGIPPLEAMSFGCPVACSQTSSIPEIVGDASIFFDPNSSESISRALETIVTDQVLARDLVARGRIQIQLFSWDRCAQETLEVYRGLMN
jgi:glycosyltransferase involved in cell wall biosynthesis